MTTASVNPPVWQQSAQTTTCATSDYNDGFTRPLAIDLECVAASRVRPDGLVSIRLRKLPSDTLLPADGSIDPTDIEPAWARYAAGNLRVLTARGRPSISFAASCGITGRAFVVSAVDGAGLVE
jgi:hypothetical protein